MNEKLSIIVPCRNEVEYIDAFMTSILSQEVPEEIDELEVLIVDGMSEDGTTEKILEFIRKDSRIVLIENPCKTTSKGLNLALMQASGIYIVRMDVHTEYAPDYIKMCLKELLRTGADNVGGAARVKAEGYVQAAIGLAYKSKFSTGGAKFHNEHHEGYVDTVPYGCWHKHTLARMGYFDEELIRNQDDELNLRIIRNGGKIFQSNSIRSWYYPRNSIIALFNQYQQYGYWKVRIMQKHRTSAAGRHLVPAIFTLALLVTAFLTVIDCACAPILIGLTAIYLGSSLIASILSCNVLGKIKYLPIMPIIFAAYHFGYALGFLIGLADFGLFSGRSGQYFTELTRTVRKTSRN
ncbi:glycosyltransferase family 2 protein [Desulfomonile tiedjei]|uniref:Glycosyl transferase n=1 Tax=Desulfomonile tiedjei (strain ATCC 49306 / DSM 6799 / DCB-1) TaxID=706587 RepID=I4CCA6_DESTA|nr:glycosyltransferase family 2 protein [Desulfomonile tiedjei]AFM27197.1 glycosyl transferase [Desulfomonile tiedjei DSM 6799]